MKTIYLMRHAKSDWDALDLEDKDRPLNQRGQRSACLMGFFLKQQAYRPDLILCSSALRTRETLSHLRPHLGDIETEIDDGLYMADRSTLMKELLDLDGAVTSVMLISHDPGLQQLALSLPDPSSSSDYERIKTKFPTAGLAVIQFPVDQWRDLTEYGGTLLAFVVPKQLV